MRRNHVLNKSGGKIEANYPNMEPKGLLAVEKRVHLSKKIQNSFGMS